MNRNNTCSEFWTYYWLFQDNVKKQDSWIISGKEAEALHLEEEDFSENEEQSDEDEDPLKKIIQSRYLFYNFYHSTQIQFQDSPIVTNNKIFYVTNEHFSLARLPFQEFDFISITPRS